MPQLLRIFTCTLLLSLGAIPALSQSAPSKPKSPGEIAAADRVAAEKRASCEREARALKLNYLKRRNFLRGCLRR